MREVTDVYGRKMIVDESTRKITGYRNKKNKIWYSAEIIEEGKHIDQYTDYIDSGIVTDYEQRIKGSHLNAAYADLVGFFSRKNDPDKEIWREFVDFVKANSDEIFDEYGDVKSVYIVRDKSGELVVK